MRIIKIEALPNGAHHNQTGDFDTIPEGWAVVPDDLVTENFPFGEVEVDLRGQEPIIEMVGAGPIYEEIDGVQIVVGYDKGTETVVGYTEGVPTVIKWTPGELPEPEPEPEPVDPAPTLDERVTVLEESNAEMTEALDLLLSGVTE